MAFEEKMSAPGHMQEALKRTGPAGGLTAQNNKRSRTRSTNFQSEEKGLLLHLKFRYMILKHMKDSGQQFPEQEQFSLFKNWADFVALSLGRAKNSCVNLWDNLQKSRFAILDHETKIKEGKSNHDVSFWKMNEDQKRIANKERSSAKLELLPREFPKSWFTCMEQISPSESRRSFNKSTCKKKMGDASRPSSSTPHVASPITDSDDTLLGPSNVTTSQPFSSQEYQDPKGLPELPLNTNCQPDNQRFLDEVSRMPYANLVPFLNNTINAQVIPFSPRSQEENEQKRYQEEFLVIKGKILDKRVMEKELMQKLLDIKGETLALEQDKLAIERKMLPLQPTSGNPGTGMSLDVQPSFNSGQQPNDFGMSQNQDFSSFDDEYLLPEWIDKNFSVGIGGEQLED